MEPLDDSHPNPPILQHHGVAQYQYPRGAIRPPFYMAQGMAHMISYPPPPQNRHPGTFVVESKTSDILLFLFSESADDGVYDVSPTIGNKHEKRDCIAREEDCRYAEQTRRCRKNRGFYTTIGIVDVWMAFTTLFVIGKDLLILLHRKSI